MIEKFVKANFLPENNQNNLKYNKIKGLMLKYFKKIWIFYTKIERNQTTNNLSQWRTDLLKGNLAE